MNNSYQPIKELTDKLLREFYSQIEKELEKIINAPSLLARFSKYYSIYSEPIDSIVWLIFVYNNQIWFVKKWDIGEFIEYLRVQQKMEL